MWVMGESFASVERQETHVHVALSSGNLPRFERETLRQGGGAARRSGTDEVAEAVM